MAVDGSARQLRQVDFACQLGALSWGKSFGLTVVAEGVETLEQHDFWVLHGCRIFQGYLFGRPVRWINLR